MYTYSIAKTLMNHSILSTINSTFKMLDSSTFPTTDFYGIHIYYLLFKNEKSRRVAESRPVCIALYVHTLYKVYSNERLSYPSLYKSKRDVTLDHNGSPANEEIAVIVWN